MPAKHEGAGPERRKKEERVACRNSKTVDHVLYTSRTSDCTRGPHGMLFVN